MTVVHAVKRHRPKQTKCGINHVRRGVQVTQDVKAVTCKSCINQGPNSTYAGVTHRLHVDGLYDRVDRDTAACGARLRIHFGYLRTKLSRVRGYQDVNCIACLTLPEKGAR